jgi:hypothetical protein
MASALNALGMSLGPYPLLGAHSSNIHGHFESIPLQELNRRVQEIALGFPDDVPPSEDLLNTFLAGQGMWPEGVKIPGELVDEGRRLVSGLVESGTISGFKDPRTVLTWPFWREVLREFPSLRVVVVPLLRSPHEIAMSLCTRSQGAYGYWSSLDLVAVHFKRMKAIMEAEEQCSKVVRFGSPGFQDDLQEAARHCGLTWNEADVLRVFDPSCVHQEPATVFHEAQSLYEELGGPKPTGSRAEQVRWLQARDARRCEALTLRYAELALESARRGEALGQQNEEMGRRCKLLEQQLSQTQDWLTQTQTALDETRDQLARAVEEMSRARASELLLWEELQRLRDQRDRFEAHPVLGPLLRSRRRVKQLLDGTSADMGGRR